MPQKKNPDALELIRGKAGQGLCRSDGAVHRREGLAAGLQQGHAGDAAAGVCRGRSRCAAWCAWRRASWRRSTFNFGRMQQAASRGFMNALAAAAHLVRQGVPFRRAHELIGKAVRLCVEQGCELEQLSKEDYALCGIAADEALLQRADTATKCWPFTTSREALPRAGPGGLTDE